METYPGLPTPVVADHLTREAAEEIYGKGVTFQIGLVTICTNTGTYLDVPFHRYADGHDLTGLDLSRVAAVDGIRIDCRNTKAIDLDGVDLSTARGKAVLIWTGHAVNWGTPAYFEAHPALTATAAERLRDARVACVGIDTLNIDATDTGDRPVHSILLGDEVPIIEHLTNLDAVPEQGFSFTAVPPKIAGAGTFTVRAFATISS